MSDEASVGPADLGSVADRQFHLGDVLSITDGHLLSPRRMGGVYDILNFVLSEMLFTHQLVRASAAVKPFLLAQYPQLANISFPVDADHNIVGSVAQLLDEQIAIYGETLTIRAMSSDERIAAYQPKNPIEELIEMRGSSEGVIVVDAPLASAE